MVTVTQKWYVTLRHSKMYPHTKFGIPTSKNIVDMLWTRSGTDRLTDRLWTDSVITICLPKFLWGHKNIIFWQSNYQNQSCSSSGILWLVYNLKLLCKTASIIRKYYTENQPTAQVRTQRGGTGGLDPPWKITRCWSVCGGEVDREDI